MHTVRAAIYARVSTKPQAGEDKVSIPDQLRECRKFIQKEDWHCAGEFIDPGISANTIERPGLKELFSSLVRSNSGCEVLARAALAAITFSCGTP
jgi:DNA invertase Pin-like site-specific DNA recombinase